MNDLIALIFLCALGALLAFCFLMLGRNEMIYRFRTRAHSICYQMGDWTIYDGKPDYQAQLWDLRGWTFKQFYPELCE